MESLNWKRLIGLGLSIFALSIGSVGLTGCEAEPEGEVEELGEDVDEGVEDVEEEAEDLEEDVEEEAEDLEEDND